MVQRATDVEGLRGALRDELYLRLRLGRDRWKNPPLWTVLLSAVFFVLLAVPIIRGSRIVWTAVMLAMVASLFLVPSQEPAAERAITAVHLVVSLTLLLHPRTQRWSRVRLW